LRLLWEGGSGTGKNHLYIDPSLYWNMQRMCNLLSSE
jgi:hypothetical protein